VPGVLGAVEEFATLLVGFIPGLDVSVVQLGLVDRPALFHCVDGGSHPDEKYRCQSKHIHTLRTCNSHTNEKAVPPTAIPIAAARKAANENSATIFMVCSQVVGGTRAFQQPNMGRVKPEAGGATINCGELMAAVFLRISPRRAPVY
jgi:hypothetical protein